jgi:hypothetical protein
MSIVCGRGQEPTLEWDASKVPLLGKLQPYLQSLDEAGKACTLAFYEHSSITDAKRFYLLVNAFYTSLIYIT